MQDWWHKRRLSAVEVSTFFLQLYCTEITFAYNAHISGFVIQHLNIVNYSQLIQRSLRYLQYTTQHAIQLTRSWLATVAQRALSQGSVSDYVSLLAFVRAVSRICTLVTYCLLPANGQIPMKASTIGRDCLCQWRPLQRRTPCV